MFCFFFLERVIAHCWKKMNLREPSDFIWSASVMGGACVRVSHVSPFLHVFLAMGAKYLSNVVTRGLS